VCAEKPEVNVALNIETTTIKVFEEKIMKGALNMVAPDVEVEGKGIILISSEEGETEVNNDKFLKDFGLMDGSILSCDDFLQDYKLKVFLYHADKLDEGQEFIVTGDKSQLVPKEEKAAEPEPEKPTGSSEIDVEAEAIEVVSNGERKRPAAEDTNGQPKKKLKVAEEDDDDDIQICEAGEPVVKKAAPAPPPPAEDGVICLE